MSVLVQGFDFKLTSRDKDVLRTISTVLKIEGRTEFSADDLYLLGLDRFYADPKHGVGGFFARCQHGKLIERVGEKRSTRESRHLAVNKVFVFSEKGQQFVEASK